MNVKKNIVVKNLFNEEKTTESLPTIVNNNSNKNETLSAKRLGNKIIKFSFQDKTDDRSPFFKKTPKISSITYVGEVNNRDAKKKYFSQRLGKDKKNLFHLKNSLLPNITINTDFIIHSNGELNYSMSVTTLGQNSDIVSVKNNSFVPFNDRLSRKFSPKEFVDSNQKIISYPNLTNGNMDFVNFKNPDAIDGGFGGPEKNGTIDVFGVVTSLINTNPSDIHVLGVRGHYGAIDQEISQYGRVRGSSIIDNKYEINTNIKTVFFEDSQEMHLSNPFDNKQKSDEGFISYSQYKSSPFKEKIINEDKYQMITTGKIRLLLSSSNIDMSEIGTRYKSANNGNVQYPFYSSTIQNSLGTDSLAFKGFMRG